MHAKILGYASLVLTALFLTFPSVTVSQEQSKPAVVSDEPDRDMLNAAWLELLEKNISMEVSKTTLGNYIKQLRDEHDGLNIIVDTSAANYQLPELQFENISIRAALKLIEQVSREAISVDIQSVNDRHDANIIRIRNEMEQREQPPIVRVINVKQLIGEIPKEALLEAFDEGYRLMDSEGAKPELRFHEPSGLLFFKGSHAQVDLAMEIVGQLERSRRAELETEREIFQNQLQIKSKTSDPIK